MLGVGTGDIMVNKNPHEVYSLVQLLPPYRLYEVYHFHAYAFINLLLIKNAKIKNFSY